MELQNEKPLIDQESEKQQYCIIHPRNIVKFGKIFQTNKIQVINANKIEKFEKQGFSVFKYQPNRRTNK